MADWADISNLWWLRPRNPQGQSSIPAFALGAQIQQNRIQNEIKTKEMMLDEQYRFDALKAQNRLTDLRLEEYNLKKKEADDEEADFRGMTPVIDAIARGQTPPTFVPRSYRGTQALTALSEQAFKQRNERNLRSMTTSQQGKMLEHLGKLMDLEPEPFARLSKEYRDNKEFSPESIGEISSLLKKHSIPGSLDLPKGWVTKSETRTLPDGTTIVVGPEEKEKKETTTPFVKELQVAREMESKANELEDSGDWEEASRMREEVV